MKNKLIYLLTGAVCVAMFLAWSFFSREGEPAATAAALVTESRAFAPETLKPVYKAYVSGAVRLPGVYEFEEGARVGDLLETAGGACDDADLDRINLSARVRDEQQIYVPRLTDEEIPAGAETGGFPVNINTAGAEELMTLPGIGEKTAGAIVDYRREHGPFASVEQLTEVYNIGEKTLERIRGLITAD